MELWSRPGFLPKMKILSILARITIKLDIELFPDRSTLHKPQAFLKYFFNDPSDQILRHVILYPRPRAKECVFFIIYSVPKTYSFIYSDKHSKRQREKEYILVCLPYVTRMHSFVIRMSLVCGFTMNRRRGLETNPPSLVLNMYRM